jgi:hypothetical protein
MEMLPRHLDDYVSIGVQLLFVGSRDPRPELLPEGSDEAIRGELSRNQERRPA